MDGVGEVGVEAGWVHGLVEVHSATYLHGRDQDGYSVEVLVGGSSGGHGALDGSTHGMDTTCHQYTTHTTGVHGTMHHTYGLGGGR